MPMLYHIWYNMSSVKLHCKKARMPYMSRYAEYCKELISRMIGLLLLMGHSNYWKPFLSRDYSCPPLSGFRPGATRVHSVFLCYTVSVPTAWHWSHISAQ
jgi:hypothetical protein